MAGKPSKIGKYDVIDVLGRGGMGAATRPTILILTACGDKDDDREDSPIIRIC